ncbi:ABC transporter substrate-binding protein [Arthrobacter sp. SLBN-112]|uniref:ABC transporter substrate-binding protein n=1 Tax=Arthrobacter sp. SLBN-112 TaxID=2768452 RepID=UPI0027AF63E4|nr:ABC transporter substrate-binding protein [Arthrobacter sp. SLBN-112]MDQ0799387.1 polar amino acid transport system substrate-binding protein [Arthrobacter sp. SLBN-112]
MSLNRKHLLATALCGVLTFTGLTACSTSSAPPSTADAKLASLLPKRYANGINVASGVYPPMTTRDEAGNFGGFDYDLGQALGERLGTKFTFTTQDFTSIIPSLQAGKHDIIMFGMNDTAERQKALNFVDYFQAGLAIVVKKGNPEGIHGLLDLCGHTVAVAKGTTQAQFVRDQTDSCAKAGAGPIIPLELPSEGEALLAVRSGQAVGDVLDAAPAVNTAETSGDGKLFEIINDPHNPKGFGAAPTGIGVLKANADLTQALQKTLQSLIEDGTYQKLLDKYHLSQYAVQTAKVNGGA